MNTIKKLSATILATLALICLIVPFTACTNDEGEDLPDNKPVKIESHVITYTITHKPVEGSKNIDITEIADVTIRCVDHNNAETQKVLTNGTTEIKIDVKAYPCTYNFYTTFTLKPGVTIDTESKYDAVFDIIPSSVITRTDGTISLKGEPSAIDNRGIDGSRIEDYCSRQGDHVSFAFDANGNLVK